MEAVLKEEEALEELIKEAPQEEVAPVVVIAGPPHSVCFETPALRCGLPDEPLLVLRTHTKHTRTHARNPHNLGPPCVHCNPTTFR